MSIRGRLRLLMSAPGRFIKDTSGAVAVIFAIALPLLAGAAALAIDVGMWTLQKRQAQGAADQAAYSAAIEMTANHNSTQAITQAKAVAAGMGFVHGVSGVTVDAHAGPRSGPHLNDSNYWEVLISKPQTGGLSSMFLASGTVAWARAVAAIGVAGGNGCIIALGSGASLSFGNNSAVGSLSNTGCRVYGNGSMDCKGGGNGSADLYVKTYLVGAADGSCIFHSPASAVANPAGLVDPYAGVTTSLPVTCYKSTVVTGNLTSPPGGIGRLCQGIDLSGDATISPGVYYVDSTFNVGKNTLSGTGVTFILSSNVSMTLANKGGYSLSAPTSGPFAGIAIMSLASLPTDQDAGKNNNNINVTGAIYFPHQNLKIDNNFNSALCTQLIALTISIKNNANMGYNCPSSGIKTVGGVTPAVTE